MFSFPGILIRTVFIFQKPFPTHLHVEISKPDHLLEILVHLVHHKTYQAHFSQCLVSQFENTSCVLSTFHILVMSRSLKDYDNCWLVVTSLCLCWQCIVCKDAITLRSHYMCMSIKPLCASEAIMCISIKRIKYIIYKKKYYYTAS